MLPSKNVKEQAQTPIDTRNRLIFGLLAVGVMFMGLASRRFFGGLPFVKNYVGDVLWALMVFFLLAFIFNKWSTKAIALVAVLVSFSIEISQLYHPLWLERMRATLLGGLVLGFSFVWSDLVCYSIGILIGGFADLYINRKL